MIYIVISFLITLLTLIMVRRNIYYKKKIIPTLLIGSAFTLTVLIYPFSVGTNMISKLVFSFIYAVQTIILNEDVSLVSTVPVQNGIDMIHVTFIYILFLLMPLFTVSFLISLLSDFTVKLKLHFTKNKEIVIFSQLNEKSIAIAKKTNNRQNTIIFANCIDRNNNFIKQAMEIKAVKLSDEIQNIDMKRMKCKNLTLYMISSDEDENLNTTLQIIDENKKQKIKLYFITNEMLSSTILDSVDKGNIQVEIVNEVERAVCEVLQEKPLFLNAIGHKIAVLIVGAGKVGTEFLKTITWCGQMIDYELEIIVIDMKANQIRDELMLKYPELIPNYNFKFIEVDINSCQFQKELDLLNDINYIIVTLNNETDSLNTAIYLRHYYLKRNLVGSQEKPIINVWIKNGFKNIQVDHLKNQKGNDYEINAFGSISNMYFNHSIINSKLEKMTKNVHLAYNKNDVNLEEFYKKDYNIRSSRAVALHIKYKMYSILQDAYTESEQTNYENFIKCLEDDYVFERLAKNEHDRWMAYMRTLGFESVESKYVKKYYTQLQHHVHFLAKLHPALVPYDEIENVEKQIGVSLKNNDSEIIRKLPNIIEIEKGKNMHEKRL